MVKTNAIYQDLHTIDSLIKVPLKLITICKASCLECKKLLWILGVTLFRLTECVLSVVLLVAYYFIGTYETCFAVVEQQYET